MPLKHTLALKIVGERGYRAETANNAIAPMRRPKL
jgi:hypothetical protein